MNRDVRVKKEGRGDKKRLAYRVPAPNSSRESVSDVAIYFLTCKIKSTSVMRIFGLQIIEANIYTNFLCT